MVRVKKAKYVRGFVVAFTFTDGSEREIDLEPYLRGRVFEPLRANLDEFRRFKIDREFGTIVWPNGADIDPDTLYLNLRPAAWETPAR
jgi:hypothetical protein